MSSYAVRLDRGKESRYFKIPVIKFILGPLYLHGFGMKPAFLERCALASTKSSLDSTDFS
jgi:hypothetical protein